MYQTVKQIICYTFASGFTFTFIYAVSLKNKISTEMSIEQLYKYNERIHNIIK